MDMPSSFIYSRYDDEYDDADDDFYENKDTQWCYFLKDTPQWHSFYCLTTCMIHDHIRDLLDIKV